MFIGWHVNQYRAIKASLTLPWWTWLKAISGLSSHSDNNTSQRSVSNEEGLGKTYLRSSCCFPLMERSHEKGAYLDEIKSKMRGSGLGLGKGDDHGQKRQGKEGGGGGQRGRETVSGLVGYGGNINLGLVWAGPHKRLKQTELRRGQASEKVLNLHISSPRFFCWTRKLFF